MSFKPSQGQRIAVTVQRGNADIMIQDSVRKRGLRWGRRRRVCTPSLNRASSRSRSDGSPRSERGLLRVPLSDEVPAQQSLAAHFIDLSRAAATQQQLRGVEGDNDSDADMSASECSSPSSCIPETPPSALTDEDPGTPLSWQTDAEDLCSDDPAPTEMLVPEDARAESAPRMTSLTASATGQDPVESVAPQGLQRAG